jgi:glycosyltransferase involved in cell wall biosynthesis
VFTIASRNYLHFARVLMASLQKMQPDWERFLLFADRLDGAFDPAREIFQVVEARSLPIPEPDAFFFRYTLLELNTAVKPWFFGELFKQGFDHVVYLDPDICVYSPMTELEQALHNGALAVLVPHLTGRIRDAAKPAEYDILLSGTYNLGFCALAQHRELQGLLEFWSEKSLREFISDVHQGLFTDQRWMDLIPGMFDDVVILRHEGYDVAYWNLPHRQVTQNGNGFLVNGDPLVFFHFSGLDPLKPEGFSKHQNRYRLSTVGPAARLVNAYCESLEKHGLQTCSAWPYAYGVLQDGSPLPDVVRRLYRTSPEVEKWAGRNPFARTCVEWNEAIDDHLPPLTRVMQAVYHARPDVRLKWPDAAGTDRESFARWFVESSELQNLVPECYVAPIRKALKQKTASRVKRPSATRIDEPTAIRGDLVGGALRKAVIAFRDGRLPLSPRRWLQLYRMHVSETAQAELLRSSPALPPVDWTPNDLVEPETAGSSLGLTIVGYLSDGTGVAAGAQASAAVCRDARIPFELVDARPLAHARGTYPVSLLHVNADQTAIAAKALGPDFFRDRYTIGLWAWELEQFPDAFDNAFDFVREVWAPSRFIQVAVSEKSPVPVVHMPLAVEVRPAKRSRRDFGLPSDRFLFLTMYDALSVTERKNPVAAIEAFRRAFPADSKVGLIVRVNHGSSRPDDLAVIRQLLEETPNGQMIDGPLLREEAQALQASCDAFVSLHRSEGFGLNIAEAMLLEKPVIVTAWSGNLDFTTPRNSCLIDYELVTLARDYGPYQKGNRWAEPDIDQAAGYMARLVDDATFRAEVAAKGRQTIATEFCPTVVGAKYRRRLQTIRSRQERSLR